MNRQHAQPALSLVVSAARREVSDDELARALRAGRAWAAEETWHRFAPMVLAMATRTLGSPSEAEDIVQEVFYRLFLRARTLRDPASLRSFVVSFAIRILRWELRRRRMRTWLPFGGPEALVDLASETMDVESRDLLRRFYGLLDRLAARDRLVFALRHLEAMTVEEVARSTVMSPSTVKRCLERASKKLLRWVEAEPALAELMRGKGWSR